MHSNHIHHEEGPPRVLTILKLSRALASILDTNPSTRTLRRWTRRGMPHYRHPANGRSMFVLDEVVAWLRGNAVCQDLRVQAQILNWPSGRAVR